MAGRDEFLIASPTRRDERMHVASGVCEFINQRGNNMRRKARGKQVLMLLIFLCASMSAWASGNCVYSSGTAPTVYTYQFAATSYDVRALAIGAVIATATAVSQSGITQASCGVPATSGITWSAGSNAPTVLNTITFTTNVNGIGIQLAPDFPAYPNRTDGPGPSTNNPWNVANIKLIKTSNDSTGTDTLISGSGGLRYDWRVGDNKYVMAYFLLQNSTKFIRTTTTCIPTISNVTVPLPKISTSSLSAVGAVSAATNFQLSLQCSGDASRAFVTLTDQQTPGNTSNTLGLTTASVAKGLGIQILYNNNPVSFGPDSAAAGNTNQFAVFNFSGTTGVYTIPLTARYIRTGTVVPGTAIGIATYTLSYQ